MYPVQICVVIKDVRCDVRKHTVPSGFPENLKELRAIILETIRIDGEFSVMYEYKDFAN